MVMSLYTLKSPNFSEWKYKIVNCAETKTIIQIKIEKDL